MKRKYFMPLIFFMVPTVIASALMWPPAAMNVWLIGGFVTMLFSIVMTYIFGIRIVLQDKPSPKNINQD
jgi:hypothetical protein